MAKRDITKRKKGEVIYDAKIDGEKKEFKDYKIILAIFLFVVVLFMMIFD